MRLRPIPVFFCASLLATVLAVELDAQTTTSGGLTGVVTDQSNAVVANADVEIRDNSKGTAQSTKTDREGVYRFFFLAPSRYLLTATHDGFRKGNRVVNVPVGPPATVNVTLEIAKASAEVTVTDEAPLVNAENGDVSVTINQKQISEVPNPGNDLTYIAQTAPGVVMNTDMQGLANFSILGMPGNSYLHTIDGMNDNDNIGNLNLVGALNVLLGQNQIQEATIVTTGYSGQFGGAAGGHVNYVTKSGGNQFHGNAQYYWNGRALNANNWFLNALGTPRPFDIANQWAGALGGPIKKERLFFFFDTEGLRLLIPQPFLVVIPSPQFQAATIANIDSDPRFGPASATDVFYKKIFALYDSAPGTGSAMPGAFNSSDPLGCAGFTGPNGLGTTVPCAAHFSTTRGRPSEETLVSGRLDWVASNSDRVFVRLQYDHSRAAAFTDPFSPVFDGEASGPWWQGQLTETHTFGSSAANQFLLSGYDSAIILKLKNPSQALSAFPTVLSFNQPPFTGLGGSLAAAFGFGLHIRQYQLSEDIVKTWGSQKLGFGANFARIHWSELPNNLNGVGSLSPETMDAFYQGGVDPATPATDFTSLTQSFNSQTTLPISFFNFGLYGQDEWRARPNLTLTLALRAEHYSNPLCRTRCFARLAGPFDSVSHDPAEPYNRAILINQERGFEGVDNVLWSPRFSFAWQPFGISHDTVLRLGFGVFYNPIPNGILDSFSGNPPLLNSYTVFGDNLTPDEKTSLYKDAAGSNMAFLNGFAAGKTLAQIQAAIATFYPPGFSPPAISVPGRATHPPQFQRWSLEWQQAFGADTSLSLGYFGHHGIHELVQDPNANAYGFGSLPAGQCTSPPVPPCADPRFTRVTQINTNSVSNYNGMVVSFKHQFTHGVFQANYTYGHAFDEVSNGGFFSFTAGSSLNPQNANNLRGSYGPAEYDVRHSFNASYVWELPVKAILAGRGWDLLAKGWQVSGTIFARSGFPYSVFDPLRSGKLVQKNYFGLIYAVPAGPLSPGTPCGKGGAVPVASQPCQPAQVLENGNPNPGALFVQAGCETGFNMGTMPGPSGACGGPAVAFFQGRNRFRGPGYFNTDFAITKNTNIPHWENAVLGIGFQFFNLFNHANFGFPDNSISSPTFGQILYLEQPPTSILGANIGGDASPRMIQLKVQLRF